MRLLKKIVAGAALGSVLTLAGPLTWQAVPGGRIAAVTAAAGTRPVGFTLLAPETTGVTFTNVLAQSRYVTNQIYLNGAGVAAGDVDGDGWCDLFFSGLDRPNVLYRNLGGWKFEDVTARAGVGLPGMSCTGATFADVDGDGDLDLVVNSVGNGTFILFNDGTGHFDDRSPGKPLNYLRAGMTAALADVDGDGDLDLYVCNYRTTTLRDMPNARLRLTEQDGQLVVLALNDRPTTEADLVGRFTATREGRIIENGEADAFYLNDGKGVFTLVPFTGGAFLDEDGRPLKEPPYDWGLTAAFRDLNGDGAPDIYVCNDFESPDRIWINDGRGRFRALDRLAMRCSSIFSMGVDFADINRDGFVDFFVSDMLSRDHARRMLETGDIMPVRLAPGQIANRPQYSHNSLFLNWGDGTFAEISQYAGVEASEWTWSPNFLDVDLDGYEDLLITTGHELQMMNTDIINRAEVLKAQKAMSNHELQRMRTMFPRYAIPNAAFRNRGNCTFEDVSERWGFNFPDVGNAAAQADLDNDGDMDIVINNLNGVAELCRNEATAPRVLVRLRGAGANTRGIGARVIVRGGPVPEQSQEIVSGGHYLSGGEAARMFAGGAGQSPLSIEVKWRDGQGSLVTNVPRDSIVEIAQATAPAAAVTPAANKPEPLFEDATRLLAHRHADEDFDDFQRQPLLPRRLSQLGPGVAWTDFDEDGWDDLLVAGGKGGRLAGFRNQGDGTFTLATNAPLSRVNSRDQTTVIGFGPVLLVGSSNYEDGLTNGGALRVYDLRANAAGESVMGQALTAGPLASADVDGDGTLDLFIGGRVVPGRYPEPASSLLLRKEGSRLVPTQRFEKLGLVSGAVFSDLNGDGAPDLILACEWGPVRIFRNERGALKEWNPPLRGTASNSAPAASFQELTGWWAGVATGDLDGDGRPDIIASNWGLNSRYRPSPTRPIRLHYGDLDDNGALDVIESGINPANGQEVPTRGWKVVQAALPFLQGHIESFEAYGKASLAEIYGDALKSAGKVEAIELSSMAFLNRGDYFEVVRLPAEAQWAPAFGVCVADFDGDGAEDVFLSQNFFAVNPDDWRQDAGRGLLLRGDGKGGLTALSAETSGVKVYGEQRGCAAADYDGDGRTDLAVGQNAAATVLLRNVRARPGLRVRLDGPAGNPRAVGASVRLKFGDRLGPAREVQAGSGYWSQDSSVLVLSAPERPSHVWVRWPGGKVTTSELPEGAKEVRVNGDGGLTKSR